LGAQLSGLPANQAGGTLTKQVRKIGIVHPSNTEANACALLDKADLEKNGANVVKTIGVTFSLSTLVNEASTAIADMKQAGVTTIVMSSADPITPRFMMMEAQSLHYYPEWWFQSYFPNGQDNTTTLDGLFSQTEIDHIIGVGQKPTPLVDQEAITAYNLGNKTPGVKPIPAFVYVYETVLQIFDALQLAGPDLTPQNFEAGMEHIPASAPGGMYAGWDGKTGPYDPTSTFGIVEYDTTATSPLTGTLGEFVWCNNGDLYSYKDAVEEVPHHVQLACTPYLNRTYTVPGGPHAPKGLGPPKTQGAENTSGATSARGGS
jgi:hypothetical protein